MIPGFFNALIEATMVSNIASSVLHPFISSKLWALLAPKPFEDRFQAGRGETTELSFLPVDYRLCPRIVLGEAQVGSWAR